jgi:ribosome recycling factor
MDVDRGSIISVKMPETTEEERLALYAVHREMGGCAVPSLERQYLQSIGAEVGEPRQNKVKRFCSDLARCLRPDSRFDDD